MPISFHFEVWQWLVVICLLAVFIKTSWRYAWNFIFNETESNLWSNNEIEYYKHGANIDESIKNDSIGHMMTNYSINRAFEKYDENVDKEDVSETAVMNSDNPPVVWIIPCFIAPILMTVVWVIGRVITCLWKVEIDFVFGPVLFKENLLSPTTITFIGTVLALVGMIIWNLTEKRSQSNWEDSIQDLPEKFSKADMQLMESNIKRFDIKAEINEQLSPWDSWYWKMLAVYGGALGFIGAFVGGGLVLMILKFGYDFIKPFIDILKKIFG